MLVNILFASVSKEILSKIYFLEGGWLKFHCFVRGLYKFNVTYQHLHMAKLRHSLCFSALHSL